MLAAMIFSASFSTGDTLTHSIRTMAVKDLGQVDIVVVREGVEPMVTQMELEASTKTSYFDYSYFEKVQKALEGEKEVDGITPAIVESVPVIAPGSSLNEPAVDLLGLDPGYEDYFDPLIDGQGTELSIQNLGDDEVYVSTETASSLEVGVGDEIDVYLGTETALVTVKGIYEKGGTPSGDISVVTSLSWLQGLRGSEDINYILITNTGGAINGAKYTDDVMGILESDETGLQTAGLKAEPIKQDALDTADDAGSEFTTVFLVFVFGSFSIIAGILLIFLIFVMLAAERKRELGISRAVGTQRAHIIRLFTFEGVLYALIASAIGVALGIAFGRGMIQVMSVAFEDMDFDLVYHFTHNSLLISYTLGVIITLIVVVFSAWRVGRMNIVRAIRDIPEPQQAGGRGIRGLIISIILPLLGLLMLSSGLQAKQAAIYMLGGSLMIIGLCLLARRFRLPDRAAYTLAGIGLLAFWIISFEFMPYEDEMTSGMEMFILSGIFYVAGAVWVIMYNSDLLLATVTFTFGRIKALAPVLKTAVSYPMASRFRTGMALAMFSLIIFTLVIIAVINASFDRVIGDTDRISGGFHIIGTVNYNNPILPDIATALDEPGGAGSDNFQAVAGLSRIPAEARQTDKEQEWEDIYLTGADSEYIENVTYEFQLTMEAYTSKEEVWAAMADDSSLAVVNSLMVPSRGGGGGPGETTDLTIGDGDFYLEDKFLPDDIYIEVQNYDQDPDKVVTKVLHVIGVVDVMAGPLAPPIITSQEIIDALAGETVYPTTYLFKVKPDKIDDVSDLAVILEKQFSKNGMDTAILAEEIKDYSELNSMFFNLITVFMGLGLIVGIAALGVIAARSVVERRQQIGVLRALGFQRRMVQFSFLLESSFIALLGIGIGIALGLILCVQLIPDMGIMGIEMAVPWSRIILIVAIAYGASLITTFIPAWQASRVYPAEALRYE